MTHLPELLAPVHQPVSLEKYETRRGVALRLHNQRIGMLVTPEGYYQLQLAQALKAGEAAELRRLGYRDTPGDFILRDRVRYSVVQFTAEAFDAAVWCWQELQTRQRRKR
ncbi:hypothetical protein HMJ29_13135 [Hymenobacter taeanensis]|uniref:Uncharacterized protein n=1 Tax=Hymenobacter taeanensis TaxID=2735321 RepID=A0A6M6BIA0_9BACT|nr:hypothetical protein [Hymenobacter taeanensis]QJX47836.1 hypothetical protein HMJ29_13135 [Hymenobacter taeanensis]